MSLALQPTGKTVNPLASALAISCVSLILLLAALLRTFGVSLAPFALLVGVTAYWWLALRHPLGTLGAVLALMPVFPLAFLVARFFGPAYIALFEGCDRAAVLLPVCILWWRNGIRFATPDWLLFTCMAIAVLRLPFDGSFIGLVADFGFVIAYGAGRATVLTGDQENQWAKRAVWIVAVLAVLGLTEVFVLGEGPRTILYLSVAEKATSAGALDGSFRAAGFTGLRESSTMFGPLQFAPLCMAALIVWWVYCRSPLLGCMIATGIVCSLSRSAWFGTALAIPLLAVVMRQGKRFFVYAAVALVLLIALAPFLGIGDFLFATKTGQDPSAQGHQDSIVQGLQFSLEHPLGIGSANFGRQATKSNESASYFESTYLTLAGEYGIVSALCFLGFLIAVVRMLWCQRTQLSYVAAAIVVGFGAVMTVLAIHDVFSLACWIWFPVGLAVRSSAMKTRMT